MLVMGRRQNQTIKIGGEIDLTVAGIDYCGRRYSDVDLNIRAGLMHVALTARENDTIRINGIEILIVRIGNEAVRIGINAPENLGVHREEVYKRIEKQGRDPAWRQTG